MISPGSKQGAERDPDRPCRRCPAGKAVRDHRKSCEIGPEPTGPEASPAAGQEKVTEMELRTLMNAQRHVVALYREGRITEALASVGSA